MPEETQTKEAQSSYRSIFKAISLFGGVQVYIILMQIIKSKVIAVLLGPLGVGIQGLYQSALDLVKQATSLGISQSAVRDVAEANGSGGINRINRTITVLRKIVWFTGLLGLTVVMVSSPLLSKASFGNSDYIIPFIFLSIILLLDQLSAGQKVVLQGMRRLKDLAKAIAIGITISLVVSLPLYYYWGIEGIVPALILTSLVSLIITWIYSRRISIVHVPVTSKEVLTEGKKMMVMGISMSISGVLTVGAGYLIRSLIRKWGGVDEVGLFQAGFVIMNSYVGLVFNAIATDYYPRLASVNTDNIKCKDVVCKQGEISVFILAPLLSLCIIAMPFIIPLLYSSQFLPADGFIRWSCVGMMFRLASWIVSFLFIAKAESKLFIINELIATFNYLWMSILGYRFGGLTGLGVAFGINYIVYFIQVYFIAQKRYDFSFSRDFNKTFYLQLFLEIFCLLSILFVCSPYSIVFSLFFFFLSVVLSILGLNRRIGILSVFRSFIHR